MGTKISITRKQLVKLTGARPYTIDYLKDCGRLPILRYSKGVGYPTLYDTSAVDIVIKHLKKGINYGIYQN